MSNYWPKIAEAPVHLYKAYVNIPFKANTASSLVPTYLLSQFSW